MQRPRALDILRRGARMSFVLMGLGMAAGLAMHALGARRLGISEYGAFAYALNNATLASLLVTLGWPMAAMRFSAQYREQEEWCLLRGLITRSHQVVLGLSIVGALSVFAVGRYFLVSPTAKLSAVMISAMLVPIALGRVRVRLLRGLLRLVDSIVIERLAIPTIVIVALFVTPVSSAARLTALWVGAAVLIRLLETARLHAARPAGVAAATPSYRAAEWGRVAGVIVIAEAARAALARGDTAMLGAISGMHDVGVYGVARRIGMFITFTLNAVNVIAGPLLASAYHGGRMADFRRVLNKAALWAALGAAPVFACVALAPGAALWLFGPQFGEYGSVVRIVALGQFANAATGPVVMALVMTGRQRVYTTAACAVAVVSLAANAFAIPRWGVHGAAWVGTASAACLNAWLFVEARRVAPRAGEDE